MYISGSTLRTSADLDNAQLFGLDVIVWQEGDILDDGGKIDMVSEHNVKINHIYYVRSACEFKVR